MWKAMIMSTIQYACEVRTFFVPKSKRLGRANRHQSECVIVQQVMQRSNLSQWQDRYILVDILHCVRNVAVIPSKRLNICPSSAAQRKQILAERELWPGEAITTGILKHTIDKANLPRVVYESILGNMHRLLLHRVPAYENLISIELNRITKSVDPGRKVASIGWPFIRGIVSHGLNERRIHPVNIRIACEEEVFSFRGQHWTPLMAR